MPSDISRTGDEQRYGGVVMQQGRVVLDRDFNALRETIDRRTDADALDFVGPCGTPDDGFKIGPLSDPASPPLWTPPSPLSPPASNPLDFSISPGTMYVGGQRVVFPASVPGQGPVEYSYFDQPEWIDPDSPGDGLSDELVYLHLRETEVSALEDPELKDVALGGPDTTQRLHLIKRVKRLGVTATDCSSALSQASAQWEQKGLTFDPATMRLMPQGSLMVSYSAAATVTSLCDPVAEGGYLGADNQLIRVQITDGGKPGSTPQLLWGTENASSLYRVSVSGLLSSSTSTALVLAQVPVDAQHIPQQGQVVEVLRTAVVLGSEPGQDQYGQSDSVVRCIAATSGIICTLSAAYQPGTQSISLGQTLPSEYRDDTNPLFVRVWQSVASFTPDGVKPTTLLYSDKSSTGIGVTISGRPDGREFLYPPAGSFWMFAVRPSTPQLVYPERFIISPQPPDGPREWVCPLATIAWTAVSPPTSPETFQAIFSSCRNPFDNLVELSMRKLGGCCSFTLRPEDLKADPDAFQNAVDRFRRAGYGNAICVTPGIYELTKPLTLGPEHSGLTIEACHGAVTLRALQKSQSTGFEQGLIVLASADDVTLKRLDIILPMFSLTSAGGGGEKTNVSAFEKTVRTLPDPRVLIGIRSVDSLNLTVVDCGFVFKPVSNAANFGAGLFISGSCTGLRAMRNTFGGPARAGKSIQISKPFTGSLVDTRAEIKSDILERKIPTDAPTEKKTAIAEKTLPAEGKDAPAEQKDSSAEDKDLQAGEKTSIDSALDAEKQSIDGLYDVDSLRSPPVLLTALLIGPSIDPDFVRDRTRGGDPQILAQAVLDQAEITGNKMHGLTVAMLSAAVTGLVRIQENIVTDCVGGFWLAGLNSQSVADVSSFHSTLQNDMPLATGAADAVLLALWYPLPALPQRQARSLNLQIVPNASLHIVNNQINALPGDGTVSGPACFIDLMPPLKDKDEVEFDARTSIVVNSNQMRNLGTVGTNNSEVKWRYAATAILFGSANIVVGHNLISNLQKLPVTKDGKNDNAAPQLESLQSLFVEAGRGGLISVSGNILRGASNLKTVRRELSQKLLEALSRAELQELAFWDYLNNNAVPGGQG